MIAFLLLCGYASACDDAVLEVKSISTYISHVKSGMLVEILKITHQLLAVHRNSGMSYKLLPMIHARVITTGVTSELQPPLPSYVSSIATTRRVVLFTATLYEPDEKKRINE